MSVETISGSGLSGNADGRADDASFVMPTGIAVDGSGAVYVADTGGQRIRRIKAGRVETVAGGGGLAQDGLWVAGDYLDGPARKARFNQPYGIAIGRDQDVYVADYANHCIRRIAGGLVETFAGHPDRFGQQDGPLQTARFAFPRAIAFDLDANMYVADRSVGIRCVSRHGDVSTIPLPANAHLDLVGIAVVGSMRGGRIFASDHDGLLVIDLPTFNGTKYSGLSEGDRPFGYPDALIALDCQRLLFTDSRSRTIRFVHDFENAPYGIKALSLFENQILDAANNGGGYRDGDAKSALLDVSRGIALKSNGEVVISDTGNRRIRTLKGLDLRVPMSASELGGIRREETSMAIVGGPLVFYDTLWSESIAGYLEALVGRPVLCVQSYNDNIVEIVGAARHLAETGIKAIVVFNKDMIFTSPVHQELLELSHLATEHRRNLLVVVVPMGSKACPWEQIAGNPDTLGFSPDRSPLKPALSETSASVKVVDLSSTFLRVEMRPNQEALFNSYTPWLNREGRRLIASSIYDHLEAGESP